MTDLSICIPTYDRARQVFDLVRAILAEEGSFEICLHDDGSRDDTFARISALAGPRLHIGRSENGGRGQALAAAIRMARGRFVMIFDDDDTLSHEGLQTILADCAAPLGAGLAGRIYHFEDAQGRRIGSEFPVARSNFLALRADHGVLGDKKEVVLREALVAALEVPGRPRRVPTSLYWARIALSLDVECRNVTIGRKTYLEGGMSDQIRLLKSANPQPLFLLARCRVHAFFLRRYRSGKYLMKSVAAGLLYGARSALATLRRGA